MSILGCMIENTTNVTLQYMLIASIVIDQHVLPLNYKSQIAFEPGQEKMCLMSCANNKGADQPAHPCSLISAFVVRYLDSIIYLDSKAKISRL